MAQLVKNPPAMRETWVGSQGWEDSLEKGKATHSSILAWRIPWTVHGVVKSWTWLSNFHFTFTFRDAVNSVIQSIIFKKSLFWLKRKILSSNKTNNFLHKGICVARITHNDFCLFRPHITRVLSQWQLNVRKMSWPRGSKALTLASKLLCIETASQLAPGTLALLADTETINCHSALSSKV